MVKLRDSRAVILVVTLLAVMSTVACQAAAPASTDEPDGIDRASPTQLAGDGSSPDPTEIATSAAAPTASAGAAGDCLSGEVAAAIDELGPGELDPDPGRLAIAHAIEALTLEGPASGIRDDLAEVLRAEPPDEFSILLAANRFLAEVPIIRVLRSTVSLESAFEVADLRRFLAPTPQASP